MSEMIAVGAKAPDFTLKDQYNNDVALKDLRGKKVLLSSHPLAWTSVCLDQMRALERNFDLLKEKNVVPLGISVDAQPSKAAWAKASGLDQMQILADFHPLGAVAKAYGIFSDEYGMSKRANVLIDEEGTVIWTKKYDIPELPDFEEILAQL